MVKKIIFKTLKISFFTTEWAIRFAYMAAAIILIFLTAYFFGNSFLFGLKGGDTAAALAEIIWFDHWYPKIPLWFPSMGGGVSYVYGYQFLAHLYVIFLHKISSLSLENAYMILGFLSVPITSTGIYFFVWSRLKNQTAALISSIFYFLSPISWVWLFFWGFYAESLSYAFILPTLIFFDIYLSSAIDQKWSFKARISLLLSVTFFILTWLTHNIGFLGMLFFFPFYVLVYPIVSQKKDKVKKTLVSIFAVFIFLFLTYTLSAFQTLHFQYYGLQSKNAGSASKEFFFKDASEWYFKPFLSVGDIPIENRRYAERNVAFAVPVWALAILGLIASFWLSKKLFVIGIYAALNFLFIYYPGPIWQILNLTGAQHYRPLIVPLRFFLPILAAFGIVAIPQFLVFLIFLWRKLLNPAITKFILKIENNLVAILSLIIAFSSLFLFRYYATEPPSVRYGPESVDFTQVDDSSWPYFCHKPNQVFSPKICNIKPKSKINSQILAKNCFIQKIENKPLMDFCQENAPAASLDKLVTQCQNTPVDEKYKAYCQSIVQTIPEYFNVANLPKLKLVNSNASSFLPEIYLKYLAIKGQEDMVRIDISPSLGSVTQAFNINNFTDSTLSLHGYQASLNHSYWGYQQSIYYNKNKNASSIANVAKWYGTKYVLINADSDPAENFDQDPKNWEKVFSGIYRLQNAPKLYSLTLQKPAILVIGSDKKAAYETFFRTAVEGMLSYDEAILVQGKANIDDYSLADLKQFNAIALFGYSYKNQGNAFSLLDKYLNEGGNVFLDTGWQYNDKDFQIQKAPAFFPINNLVWSNQYNKSSKYSIEDPDFAKTIDSSKFSPLDWANQSWGVSIPTKGKKDWAKTILSIDNTPLVASGNHGKGKIIWSGLNWMGHINAYKNNPEEIKFLNSLFKSLISTPVLDTNSQDSILNIKRDFPDKVEFTVKNKTNSQSFLYFRESYHPDWKAYLQTSKGQKNLQIYKSGPLYKLLMLPPLNPGEKVVFEYTNGIRGYLANLLSIVTLIALLTYLFVGIKIINPLRKFSTKLTKATSNKFVNIQSAWKDEEE